jgi:hypothetical protein
MGSCELKCRPKIIDGKRNTGMPLASLEIAKENQKNFTRRRRPLKPVSDKRKKEIPDYNKLKAKLILDRWRGFYFESELNGVMSKEVEPHHIDHRENGRLTNPFNIIILTRGQHEWEGAHHSFERIQELKAIVRPIRIKQGFKESDY